MILLILPHSFVLKDLWIALILVYLVKLLLICLFCVFVVCIYMYVGSSATGLSVLWNTFSIRLFFVLFRL